VVRALGTLAAWLRVNCEPELVVEMTKRAANPSPPSTSMKSGAVGSVKCIAKESASESANAMVAYSQFRLAASGRAEHTDIEFSQMKRDGGRGTRYVIGLKLVDADLELRVQLYLTCRLRSKRHVCMRHDRILTPGVHPHLETSNQNFGIFECPNKLRITAGIFPARDGEMIEHILDRPSGQSDMRNLIVVRNTRCD
jgi:hypothetical protein